MPTIDREWLKRKIKEDPEEGEIGAGFELFPLPDTMPAQAATRGDISPIEEAITEYWGERCLDFDADCSCCQAWRQLDSFLANPHHASPRPPARTGE
ncbi:MAG: hypothetical protein EOQ44_25400 [Mesorhizobium sp.]|uniref:hypothetical protein n=1 Tax=Mesorhizobium sp. TaxID=1871066 RepID=UPI000FE513F6|nr:hypothetical protein [Mesorhizobium sp.]RWB40477.1 MAG: hypothetical protein EOQ44_25400 [Mesorhizobium sp.]